MATLHSLSNRYEDPDDKLIRHLRRSSMDDLLAALDQRYKSNPTNSAYEVTREVILKHGWTEFEFYTTINKEY